MMNTNQGPILTGMTDFRNQNNNGYFSLNEISSHTYKVLNCTPYEIFLVDGSTGVPTRLTPLMDAHGTINGNIPREYVGHIVIIANDMIEDPTTGNETWKYAWSRVIGSPQIGVGISSAKDFVKEVKDFDMILFGDQSRANQFVQRFGNYYNYLMRTDFGTRFANSANYGILNCTGKTLFQVDDTAMEDINQSDIIEIPSGDDAPLPLWDNQQFNNAKNVKSNSPYIRAYRYSMVVCPDGSFRGVMREHIYTWTPDCLNEDGFLYIPYHHMCLFDDREQAENFVRAYKSVERYHTIKTGLEMEEKLQKKIDDAYNTQKRDHKRIVAACSIILSLSIASKLGEVLQDYLKNRSKNKTSSKRKGGKK